MCVAQNQSLSGKVYETHIDVWFDWCPGNDTVDHRLQHNARTVTGGDNFACECDDDAFNCNSSVATDGDPVADAEADRGV